MNIRGVDAVARLCGLSTSEALELGVNDAVYAAAELSGLPENDPQVWMLAGTALLFKVQKRDMNQIGSAIQSALTAIRTATDTLETRERELFEHITKEKEFWDREGMITAVEMLKKASKVDSESYSTKPDGPKGLLGIFDRR